MLFGIVSTWIGLGVVSYVGAQASIYAQCGGLGFSGPTTCEAGTYCVYLNPYYSQCLIIPEGPSSLDYMFKAAGKQFWGTTGDQPALLIPQNANITAIDFGGVTSVNAFLWDVIEPTQGSFNFTLSSATILRAIYFSKQFHGFTYIWDQHLPAWVTAINDPANLTAAVQNHLTTVLRKYAYGGIPWSTDIITEPLNEDGSIKSTHFTKVLGSSVFAMALQTARTATTNGEVKLYISDSGLTSNNTKVGGMVKLVKELNANGTLVDGIGVQAHLAAGGARGLQGALEALAEAGVDIAITQLDIAGAAPSDYTAVAKACLAVPSCVSITSSGIRDTDSPRASTHPLLFDANWNPKPAYAALLNLL